MATYRICLLVLCIWSMGPSVMGHPDPVNKTDISGKTYSFIIEMSNKAGQIGESVNVFTRGQKDPSDLNIDYVSWEYYPEGSAVTIWGENNPDDILDPTKFSHTLSDVGNDQYDYNLTVVADPTVSGPYRAKFMLDPNVYTQAEVVILDILNCPPEGQDKHENQEVLISCDTYYYGYKNPVMRWFTEYGEVPGNVITVDEENKHVRATVNISAGPEHDLLTFRCQLTFEMDEGETSTPPTYEDECTTYYYVNHAVSDIEIDPNPDDAPGGVLDMCIDQVISCSASGRPLPSYTWYCDDDQIIVEGEDLFITEDFVRPNNEPVECRCVAQNVVDGQPQQVEKQVNFVAYATTKCYTFLVDLENIAGKIGDAVNLYTRAKKDPSNIESDYVAWQYFPGEVVQIWGEQIPDEILDPLRFAHIFTDLGNNIFEYNLTIYADATLSGPYQALFLLDGDVKTKAEVVIVDTLGCPPEGQVKEENEHIITSCDTYYYGYKNPTLSWYTQDGEVASNLVVLENRVIATANFTAAPKHDELTFYCRLTFEADEGEAAAPMYEDECTTFYNIIYGVTNITINPNPDDAPGGILEVDLGSYLNCSASGRPAPTYSWACDDGQVIPGQSLLITESFISEDTVLCTCEAQNVVNGQPLFAEKDVNFVVTYAVKNVELQPNPDDAPGGILQMEVGEFINCSADGRPDPTYSWSCNDGQVIQGPNLEITDSFVREDTTQFTCECQAMNTINGQLWTAQKNATFQVYYGVYNITMQPNPDNAPGGILEMSVGEFINCSADGRPEPTYNWTCDNGQIIPGSNLLITDSFIREGNRTVLCTCTAQNVVKGQTRTEKKQVYFVVKKNVTGCSVWKRLTEGIAEDETVIFEEILYNEGGNYNHLTGEFLCPVDGEYFASVTGKADNTQRVFLAITKNGEDIVQLFEAHSKPYNTVTNSCVMRCEAGDVITVTGYFGISYVYGDASVPYSSFTVTLLNEDGGTEQSSFDALTAWKSAIQSVFSGSTVTFPEIVYDSPNYISSIYTCPENGLYLATLNLLKFNTYDLHIGVEHNSDIVLSVEDSEYGNTYNQVGNTVLLECAVDEEITVKAVASGSVYGQYDYVWTTLNVILMKSEVSYSSFIVGCSVWMTSTQSYSIDDIIRYDGIAVNRGNHFNQITSQFVCPTEAVYHVTATAKKSSTSDLQVNILRGTDTLFRLEDLGSGIPANTVSSSALVRCAAGEVIQVKAAGDGSIYGSAGGVFSTFTVIKIN